ncbi:hypothetical protein T05_460 [Trichinella murrelli]|uniref:Uncharacterized protein n=1 Tax=Trichinella murrelli TaxID=144512 RepID=A0A0V0TQD8_9BILA|nr:hypothetical protein T05_460 [Trichinella murrelli]
MKIGGGESERQKGKEIRPSIPARRQIATDAPIIWWKKRTSLLEGATRYMCIKNFSSKILGIVRKSFAHFMYPNYCHIYTYTLLNGDLIDRSNRHKNDNTVHQTCTSVAMRRSKYNFRTYHWLNYEKGADSTIVSSRAARFRNTMMKLIVNHDPVELAYRSRHIWTWRSVAEYSSGQKRGSDWCCAVLVSGRSC